MVPLVAALAADPFHVSRVRHRLLWREAFLALLADLLVLADHHLVGGQAHVLVEILGLGSFEPLIHLEPGVVDAPIYLGGHHEVVYVVVMRLLLLFAPEFPLLPKVIKPGLFFLLHLI